MTTVDVKTIDVHAHALIPKAFALLGHDITTHQFPDMDEQLEHAACDLEQGR
jgi:hypothetical protein